MKRWVPSREVLMRSRWLAPSAHHLEDDRLWHMERGCVARAVAIGLFFGLLLPTAQFLLAVLVAIWLRGHVAVAAAATLVSNPLTFAPVYWLAHRIGSALLGGAPGPALAPTERAGAQSEAVGALGWLTSFWETVQAAGAPLLLGLAVLALIGALAGFTLVWLLWRAPTEPVAGARP
jgi:uncharacterized protein (DUF2062 family)